MREIKFRGYSKSRGWVFGSYATDKKDYHAIIVPDQDDDEIMINIIVDPDSVGQYTGLKSKDGAEIYEGDIMKRKTRLDEEEGEILGAVVFDCNVVTGCPTFHIDDGEQYYGTPPTDEYFEHFVIGNIYENPELIK